MVVLSLASIVRYCFTKLLQKKEGGIFMKKEKRWQKIIAIMMTLLLFYNF